MAPRPIPPGTDKPKPPPPPPPPPPKRRVREGSLDYFSGSPGFVYVSLDHPDARAPRARRRIDWFMILVAAVAVAGWVSWIVTR